MWCCSTYGRRTSFPKNKRGNDNLEQQAQALFKSWFVDFEPFKDGEFVDSELGMIPKGWRVVCLGEVTKQVTEKVGNREDVTVLSPVNSGELVLSEEYFTKQVFSKNLSKYLIVNPLSFAYNPARINIGSIGLNEYDFVGCVSPVYVSLSVNRITTISLTFIKGLRYLKMRSH